MTRNERFALPAEPPLPPLNALKLSTKASDCSQIGFRPGCDGKVVPPAGPPDERPLRASVEIVQAVASSPASRGSTAIDS